MIVVKQAEELKNLQVDVEQGPVSPDSSFSGGTYGEFWIIVRYEEYKERFHGFYETGPEDRIVENMSKRFKKEMEELKKCYHKQHKEAGFVELVLTKIAHDFGHGYREI